MIDLDFPRRYANHKQALEYEALKEELTSAMTKAEERAQQAEESLKERDERIKEYEGKPYLTLESCSIWLYMHVR